MGTSERTYGLLCCHPSGLGLATSSPQFLGRSSWPRMDLTLRQGRHIGCGPGGPWLCLQREDLGDEGFLADYVPDFTLAYQLQKAFSKDGDHRRLYYLDVVLQGVSKDYSACQVYTDQFGAVRCRRCQAPVTGPVFAHLAYFCQKLIASG